MTIPNNALLARTSWLAMTVYAAGPLVFLFVLWLLFSEKTASEVFSWSTLTESTRNRPNPMLVNIFILAYFLMTIYKVVAFIKLRGKYLYTKDGILIAETRDIIHLRDIDSSTVQIEYGLLNRKLKFVSRSGSEHVIRMTFASFDSDELVSRLQALSGAFCGVPVGQGTE